MKLFASILALVALVGCQAMHQNKNDAAVIKGNKEITVHKPDVGRFDRITIHSDKFYNYNKRSNGRADVYVCYTQQPGAPAVEVTVDKNLVGYLDIYTKNGVLYIGCENSRSISPSRMEIRIHSDKLAKLQSGGPIEVIIDSPVKSAELEIGLAGSGGIRASHRIDAGRLDVKLTGSGDIALTDMLCRRLTGAVVGSGDLVLKGQAEEGTYQVTGSGDIGAYGCVVQRLDCHITGSGDIQAHASDQLNASVTGSGDIVYRGNPRTKLSKTGSGEIIRSAD